MNIKETLTVLNEMQSQGIIASYALGGAVAASFYLEVAATEDIDVFVVLKLGPGGTLISLSPIYDYLRARGYEMQGEYVVISGWPVQFLAPDSPLVEEALQQAVVKNIDGIPVRTFTAEHLIAISLKLARPKDKARLVQFLEASNSLEARIKFDESVFNAILERHGLVERWTEIKKQLVR
jgi:hypothetical protein